MPTFIFPLSLRINTDAYIKWLKEVVLTWIEREATRRQYIWPLDCAKPHQQENPVLTPRKFLWSLHPELTSQTAIFLDIMSEARLREK